MDMLPEAETPEAPGYILQDLGSERREDFGKGPVWDARREQHARAMADDLTEVYDKNHELERDLAGVIDKCQELEKAAEVKDRRIQHLLELTEKQLLEIKEKDSRYESLQAELAYAQGQSFQRYEEIEVLKANIADRESRLTTPTLHDALLQRMQEIQKELTEVKRENTLLVQKEAGWERRVVTLREIIGERERTIEAQRNTLTSERIAMQKARAENVALKHQGAPTPLLQKELGKMRRRMETVIGHGTKNGYDWDQDPDGLKLAQSSVLWQINTLLRKFDENKN